MTRVLLTGGSGFIATHILDVLLEHGHFVRFTVRSEEKGRKIIEAYPEYSGQIEYVIVKDIAEPGAFDDALKSDPPFEVVIHTASPFHFKAKDIDKEILDPAINGTTGILETINKQAPSVKRVVITSSFAAIINPENGLYPGGVYSEADWNPITRRDQVLDARSAYRASKTLAERAAWKFVDEEKPNFDLVTINPPLVLGAVKPYIHTIDNLNTSNEHVRNMLQGIYKEKLGGDNAAALWVNVRDVAEAHLAAMENPLAGGKRFFVTEGSKMSYQKIADIVVKNFPEYKDKLPEKREPNNGYPEGETYKADNSRSTEVLGLKYRGLEQTVVELVKSLKELGL